VTTTPTLEIAIKQIQFSREYMLSLIADVDDADWFRMPAGASTHVGWQVGHLAMAQYGLCLFRQRGRAMSDSELMSSSFRKQFSKGSKPEADVAKNPSPQEIRDVLKRVYDQSMLELPQLTEATLNEPVDMPYSVFPTKLGALFFCAQHEMIHAGQIGLLRRLLGQEPIR
jgi:hypothetical protein